MRTILLVLGVLIAAILGAVWYFSIPDIPRAVLEAKYATPPSQFLTLADGTRAHVRDRGPRAAPALVLIHGSNASLFTWEPWASRLDGTFRIVSMDLPAHGLTGATPSGDYSGAGMVKFVKAVTDKLGLEKFAIAGNSMGGGVAARFAETYPNEVSALILVDAAGMPQKSGPPLLFRMLGTPVINKVFEHVTPRSLVVQLLNQAVVRKLIITNAMIDQYWEFARMTGTRQATNARFSLPPDPYVYEHVADIKAPTLVLWGEEDHLIPIASGRAWAKAIPGAKLITYAGTGHIPQEEVPDRSAEDVKAFLLARWPQN